MKKSSKKQPKQTNNPMYYAAYKGWNKEIATFNSSEARDNWVGYKDSFSVALGENEENSILKRRILSVAVAENLIKNYVYVIDDAAQEWFVSQELCLTVA